MAKPDEIDHPQLAQDEDEVVRRAAVRRRRAQRAEIEQWFAETERIDHGPKNLV